MFISQFIDKWIDRYPTGYIEVLASVSVQVVYLIFGLFVEWIRPSYMSGTSRKMLVESLLNHAIATIVHVVYVFSRGGESVLTRTFTRPYSLPLWRELVSDLVVGLLLRDVLFYIIHRLWHVPGVYEWVHAKHHEVQQPGEHHVWTISYMSVVDFLILYGVPVMAGAKVLEMNIMTTMAFALLSAVGEQVKLVYGDNAHEEHHVDMTVNYGVYGFMDSIFGTSSGLFYVLYIFPGIFLLTYFHSDWRESEDEAKLTLLFGSLANRSLRL